MLDPIVSTKLRPSQARPKLVSCPRLIGRLDPEPGRRLTLVSAPAGFGKTTLLGRWVDERAVGERPVAWLSLDDGDNDPARFLGGSTEMIVTEHGYASDRMVDLSKAGMEQCLDKMAAIFCAT